jgi:hypothetical protein
VNDEIIAKFGESLRGPVIVRNHPENGEARKLYNAMIDKRPLLIARCADVADVIAAPGSAWFAALCSERVCNQDGLPWRPGGAFLTVRAS